MLKAPLQARVLRRNPQFQTPYSAYQDPSKPRSHMFSRLASGVTVRQEYPLQSSPVESLLKPLHLKTINENLRLMVCTDETFEA